MLTVTIPTIVLIINYSCCGFLVVVVRCPFILMMEGSRMKYEWDSDIGFLRLDRVLHSAVFYPHDYG